MSNILSAVKDDIDKYKKLCLEFGEKVKYSRDAYGNLLEDCYGVHAKKLIEKDKRAHRH